MDFSIAAILAQDGVSTGAIYALLALATVLLFSVTRIIFIPQGEFVAFGALTMAAMQSGKFAGTANLLLVFGMVAFLMELYDAVKQFRVVGHTAGLSKTLLIAAGKYLIFPLVVFAVAKTVPTAHMPMLVQAALTLAIVVPMGPLIYRVAFQSLAEASVLVLLIVSVGVHFALVGIGLVIFGAEGSRTTPFSDASYQFGTVTVTGLRAPIVGVSIFFIAIFFFFF